MKQIRMVLLLLVAWLVAQPAMAALPSAVDTALDNIAVDVAAAGAIMLLGVVAVMVVKYIMAVII